MAPGRALLSGSPSLPKVIYGHANAAVCSAEMRRRCPAGPGVRTAWACVRRSLTADTGTELAENHRARWRDGMLKVLTVTDGVEAKLGQARQVSGKQTPGDGGGETNTSQSQIGLAG